MIHVDGGYHAIGAPPVDPHEDEKEESGQPG
jgi:enoyl-[acyl-carrier protein] reductase I